jgi:hypothetical protein
MKILTYIIHISILLNLISCSSEKGKGMKVKLIGVVDTNISLNSDLYDDNKDVYYKVFDGSDTTKFIEIEKLFSGDSSTLSINDSVIIRKVNYEVNEQMICCEMDTTRYFIEKFNDTKYMFLMVGGIRIYILELENNNKLNINKRKDLKIPTWNLDFNSVLNENLFKDSISIFQTSSPINTFRSKTEHSIYINNRDLRLTTLKFPENKERVITQIEKGLSQYDFDKFNQYMNKYQPEIKKIEEIKDDNSRYTYYIKDGIFIMITENTKTDKSSYSDWDTDKYDFQYSDFYTLSKNLIERIGKEYKLVDDKHLILFRDNLE